MRSVIRSLAGTDHSRSAGGSVPFLSLASPSATDGALLGLMAASTGAASFYCLPRERARNLTFTA